MSKEPSGTNIEGVAPEAEEVVETDEANITDDAELGGTLGLRGGLGIGVGTMMGVGIFVFPVAGVEVGTGATASFAVGGVVALLVALPTSELATAMPKGRGGYYFISRGLGTLAGTVVCLSLARSGLCGLFLVGMGFCALVDAVSGHDAVVTGEKAPSVSSFVFGDEADRLGSGSVCPVVVVRYDRVLE